MRSFSEQSSWIRKMFEEGAKMKAQFGADNVFDFSLGNPDLPPPHEFKEVLQTIINDETPGQHAYMPNGGYPWVKEVVAAKMSNEQGVNVMPGDVLMTCGAAGALNITMKALLDPGDEVILLAPFFVEYKFYVDNHGGASKIVNTNEQFELDLQEIEKAVTEKTKAIIINSPNNPSGQIYSRKSLDQLSDLLRYLGEQYATTIYLIADEPYRKIVFGDHEVPSIFASYSNSIVLSSYSKDLSLPGERIGYLAVQPDISEKKELLDALTLANRILGFVNAPALMQRTISELQHVSVDNSIYEKRRNIFCTILEEAGFDFIPPKGAFYVFPKTPIEDDVRFCEILQQEKILAVPGRGFGFPGYIRLAFCVDEKVIENAAEPFKRAFANGMK